MSPQAEDFTIGVEEEFEPRMTLMSRDSYFIESCLDVSRSYRFSIGV